VSDSSKSFGSLPQYDPAAVEEAVRRIRDMNERLIESSKSAGQVALDAYENALQSMLDFQTKIASGSQLDWVSALATAHATYLKDLSAAYVKAARESLK
jgi:hypothetical protein